MMLSPAADSEFAFTTPDFEKVRGLIHRHAGIALAESKQNMVYSRLARRLRALKLRSFGDYLALVEHGVGEEWQSFVNSLTTNLTYFFREPHHFTLLAELLQNLRDQSRIRLWCAAASTGEEAYSMAITAIGALGPKASKVEILATDIDTGALDTGRRGFYSPQSVCGLEASLVQRYFLPAGTRPGARAGMPGDMLSILPEAQALVKFRQVNLQDRKWPVSAPFDAIFCRNVLIYFDRPTQTSVLARFVPLLQPHGRLFVGHTESFGVLRHLLRLEGRTVYRLAPVPDA